MSSVITLALAMLAMSFGGLALSVAATGIAIAFYAVALVSGLLTFVIVKQDR